MAARTVNDISGGFRGAPKNIWQFVARVMADPQERAPIEKAVSKMRKQQNAAVVSYLAWRMGRGFGLWHQTRDNRYTLCGRRPDGLLSVWPKREPPPVEDQCSACRKREADNR